MKNFILIVCLLFIIACQREEFILETTPTEESFLEDAQLKELVTSIALHDGSFDDVIDNSDCFSINFPYQISYNNVVYSINGKDDLSVFDEADSILPIFPITVTFSNHKQIEILNYEMLLNLQNNCNNGLLLNDFIACVDFNYPMNIALFNSESGNFSTVIYDHDRKTYQSIEGYNANTLASIQYPITINVNHNLNITISNNEELKSTILQYRQVCN